MASYVVFDPCITFSHSICVEGEDVGTMWERSLVFLTTAVTKVGALGFSPRSLQSSVHCGVYCHRLGSTQFVVGFVTKGTSLDCRVTTAVVEWANALGLRDDEKKRVTTFEKPPICSKQQQSRITLWWEPMDSRIMPMSPIPQLKVFFESLQPMHHLNAYTDLKVFLLRPSDGEIRGPTTANLQERGKPTVLRHSNNPEFHRYIVHFNHLMFTTLGEHLMGVTVPPSAKYAHFVPNLTAVLSPFLVVSHAQG